MKLPFHLFNKKAQPDYFLAFILKNEKAIAVIFEKLEEKARVIGKAEENFKTNVEVASPEELLDVSDKAISKAEEVLPPSIETKKAIFGLKSEWVEDNKIKKDYLEKLKKVSKELGLTPIGFLVTSEAIINLLKSDEGAPLTAIFAEISKSFITVSLIRAGKIIESKGMEIQESIPNTVDLILKHFSTPEILPARIIIFDASGKELNQQFIGHQWSKSLPFLHLPQTLTLPTDFDVKGILFGAASQLGFEIMPEFLETGGGQEEIAGFNEESLTEVEEIRKDLAEPAEEKNKEEEKIEPTEEEVKKEHEEFEEKTEGPKIADGDLPGASEFGFLEGEDIAKNIKKAETAVEEEKQEEEEIKPAQEETEDKEEPLKEVRKRKFGMPTFLASLKGNVFGAFGKMHFRLSQKFPAFLGKGKLLIPLAVIFLVAILYVVYIFTVSATIILSVSPKISQEKQSATFSTSAKTSISNKIISAQFSPISEEGSASVSTTGKKETGTNAKGTVTFYSRLTEDRTIAKGTSITYNGLDFNVDGNTKIASASADASASPSTANASVTADKIGKEYNLPAGSKFSVANLSSSDIIAKNDNPFSGGTKKDITVVAKEDVDKVTQALANNLKDKAKDDLTKKLSSDQVLLPALLNPDVTKKSQDKNVGDEASKLNFKGTVDYQGVVYLKNDLISFAKSLLKNRLSKDQTLNEKDITVSVENAKSKNDKEVTADLKISAKLLPKIDEENILKKVAGMSVSQATDEFMKINQAEDVRIAISPSIPFLPKSMPRFPKNIKVVIKGND